MSLKKDAITLRAYAKINLSLYITGIRADGYHLLDSVFVPVSMYDRVTVMKSRGVKLSCGGDVPCGASNTAYKAAAYMMESAGIEGANILIEKNIPHMAGLGGASTDAAAVLIGINKLYNLDMDSAALADIGLKIGADVPFFLGDGAAKVEGIGEKLTPVEINTQFNLVVIKPAISLSTPEVYKMYDTIESSFGCGCDKLVNSLEKGDLDAVCGNLENQLQPAAEKIFPQIREPIDFLINHSAKAALMTGSGSCVFGVFENERAAEKAAAAYHGAGRAFVARPVKRPVDQDG